MSAYSCEKHIRLNIYPVFYIDLLHPFYHKILLFVINNESENEAKIAFTGRFKIVLYPISESILLLL